MPPGVVSFDLDGTLWEFAPMMDGALAAAIDSLERRHPELAGRLTVADLHRHRELVGRAMQGTLEELRRESFREALRSVGGDPQLAEWLGDELLAARADVVGVHSDVEPVVDELLARGHVVGAITNGNFPFEQLALAERFAFVVHAEHVGEMKPAAAPFRRAVELAGADAGAVGARGRRDRHRRGGCAGLRDAGRVAEPVAPAGAGGRPAGRRDRVAARAAGSGRQAAGGRLARQGGDAAGHLGQAVGDQRVQRLTVVQLGNVQAAATPPVA